MARTSEEWSALLGSALSKMALVRGTDSPDAYLPDDCYPVIEKVFEVAMQEARAEGYAAATRDIQKAAAQRSNPSEGGFIRQLIRSVPMVRLFA
jgi:hypothetical protein